MDPTLLIFIAIIFVFVTIGTYNRFIKFRNRIEESWSGIDVALKRRFNLIPNMINTVKLYNQHEADMLAQTTEARHGKDSLRERSAEESAITQSLQGLMALAEAYPDLKASQNFMTLQTTLSEVEKEIQEARLVYNAAVRKNNTLVQSFPSNIIARLFNFGTADYFSLDLVTQRAMPEVK